MTKDEVVLWEGPCAYARRTREGRYAIVIYSTNCVIHIAAGEVGDASRAERLTQRLNAYPRQTRAAYGLL